MVSTITPESREDPAGTRPARPLALPGWAALPVGLGAGVAIAGYVAVALVRMRYPFELEWMEGGSVDHVRRVLAGKPLYVRPSLEFVPYIYTPLYFYVAAAAAKVLGLGFFALRLVSFAASVGSAATIFLLVRRETRSSFLGLVSCGLFLACYRAAGAWYDVARVDSLFLFLSMLAAYRCRFTTSRPSAAVAGSLAALAFLTKQSGLIVGVSLAVYLFRRNRTWGAIFIAVLGASVLVTTMVADARSGGWYRFYVFDLPRRHEILHPQILRFWTRDMARLGPAILLAAGAAATWLRSGQDRNLLWFYGPFSVSMIGASWLGRIHSGGYDNVLIPAFAAMSVLFGLGARTLLTGERRAGGAWRAGAFLAFTAGQFFMLAYNPVAQLPSRADQAAGRQLMATITSFDGEVWMPGHGHFTAQAGRGTFAQGFAMLDVLRAEGSKGKEALLASVAESVTAQRFSAVIVDSDPEVSVLPPDFYSLYHASRPLFSSPDALYPVTGARLRPETVFLPLQPPPAGPAHRQP